MSIGRYPASVPTSSLWVISIIVAATLVALIYVLLAWRSHQGAAQPPSRPRHKPTGPRHPQPGASSGPGTRSKPSGDEGALRPSSASTVDEDGDAREHWLEEQTLAHRREWVRVRVEHWWQVAVDAHTTGTGGSPAANVPPPSVKFSGRLRHALGWADSSRNLINISDHHLMDKPKHVADSTVAHEVAHIFADRHHGRPCRHDRRWKQVMIAMGQKPDVCYTPEPADQP